MDFDQRSIEQRLSALERSARRWRAAAVILCLVIVAGVAIGAEKAGEIPEVIKCKAIEVIGSKGKPILSVNDNGSGDSFLTLYDRSGEEVIDLQGFNGSGTIHVNDAKRQSGVTLSAGNGGAFAGVRQPDGETIALVTGNGAESKIRIRIQDSKRKEIWTAP